MPPLALLHLHGDGPHAGRHIKDLLDVFLHAHEAPELLKDPGVCVLLPQGGDVVGDDVFIADIRELTFEILPGELELVSQRCGLSPDPFSILLDVARDVQILG